MRIHVYRPPIFVYSLRKIKFTDENGKLLSFVHNDNEVIINNAPATLKAKLDWLSGKVENLEDTDVYLISYIDQNIFWKCFTPSGTKKYIQFKSLSKEQYEEAVATQGQSLDFLTQIKVSKTRSIASRLLSFLMLCIVGILFYHTDYSTTIIHSQNVDSIRFLALIMGFGSLAGLIWNLEKHFNLYLRATLFTLLTMFFVWNLSPESFQMRLFLYPLLGILFLVGFYSLSEKREKRSYFQD